MKNTTNDNPIRGLMKGKQAFILLYTLTLILSVLLIQGCRRKPAADTREVVEKKPIEFPAFNADSAYQWVAAQVRFGPRVVNTPSHKACGDYLFAELQRFCDTVYVQEGRSKAWNGEELRFRNIIGVFKPLEPSRIFISSHWDSRPYADHDPDPAFHRSPIDGANDGASGVGVILELARVLSQNPPPQGIDLILFDAEDYGEPQGSDRSHVNNWGLGSQYWSAQPHVPLYRARYGILLDMVGVPNPRFTWEGTSRYYAPDILIMVWNKAAQAGHAAHFVRDETPPIVDDHYFINERIRIPTIDIIHHDPETPSGFFRYWHTRKDNMDYIDPQSLKMVGEVVIRVIYEPS